MRRTVLLPLLGLWACHGVPGTTAAAHGERRFTARDQTYSVAFLSPPWTITAEDGETLELEVPPEVLGLALDGTPPSHVFQIGHVDAAGGLEDFVEEDDEDEPGDTDGLGSDSGGSGGPPEIPDTDDGLGEDDGLPDYFIGLDLADPYAVALAELNHLIDAQDAELDHEVSSFVTDKGAQAVEFQVQMSPGIFVRAFYFDARPTVVRATFVSLFDLETGDVERMAASIDTELGGES